MKKVDLHLTLPVFCLLKLQIQGKGVFLRWFLKHILGYIRLIKEKPCGSGWGCLGSTGLEIPKGAINKKIITHLFTKIKEGRGVSLFA